MPVTFFRPKGRPAALATVGKRAGGKIRGCAGLGVGRGNASSIESGGLKNLACEKSLWAVCTIVTKDKSGYFGLLRHGALQIFL